MSHTLGHQLRVLRQTAGPFLFHEARIGTRVGLSIQLRRGFLSQSPYQSATSHDSDSSSYSGFKGKVASGSLLLLGLSTSSAVENGSPRVAASPSGRTSTSNTLTPYKCPSGGSLSKSALRIWKRALHTKRDDPPVEKPGNESKDETSSENHKEDNTEYSLLHRNIRERLPNLHQFHRPTKEELLAAATGFWSRLRVRFKWFSIRSVRPFNLDEIGALFSWVLLGHVLWIILGTTTFFSLLILTINTVFAQGKSPLSSKKSLQGY